MSSRIIPTSYRRHIGVWRVWLFIAAGAVLSACGSAQVPQDYFYRLNLPQPAAAEPVLVGTLEVDRFLADGLLTNRPIVYTRRDQENQLQTYNYHFWTEPPAIMLQDALAVYARESHFARAVVTPEMRIDPDFIVGGKLRRFEQITGGNGAIAVEMEISLRELKTNKLIYIGTYRAEVPTPNETVSAAVNAINTAVADIFAKFLREAAAARGQS